MEPPMCQMASAPSSVPSAHPSSASATEFTNIGISALDQLQVSCNPIYPYIIAIYNHRTKH